MSLLGLSLFDTGLMITIITLLVLYLIVLIKLKPSAKGKEIPKTNSMKKNIPKELTTERQSNPKKYDEPQENSVEKTEPTKGTESVKKPKPTPSPPIKTEISKGTHNSGCPHHFGYLGEHPKNTPIPNECLTCVKIMECLLGVE